MRLDSYLDGHGPPAYERFLGSVLFAERAEPLLDPIGPEAGDRVLDVAGGTGIVARRARAVTADVGRLVGCDLNDAMLDVARALEADPDQRSHRDAVADRLNHMLTSHVDDEGVVFPVQTWLVTAKRAAT